MKRLLTIALLLIALLMGSCARPVSPTLSHRTLILTYWDTSQSDLVAIQSAVDEWRVKTNSIATFDIRLVDRKPARLGPTDVFVEWTTSADPSLHSKTLLGSWRREISTLTLVRDRIAFQDDLRAVLLHEIGHVLGLGHQQTRDSIMLEFPLITARHITGNDQVAFCKLYNCDPFALP